MYFKNGLLVIVHHEIQWSVEFEGSTTAPIEVPYGGDLGNDVCILRYAFQNQRSSETALARIMSSGARMIDAMRH